MKIKNNKKGFTLVELVIVIAVIAILAAVLIPTFATVIANANKSAAQSEGSNLYTGILVEYAEYGFDKYCEEYEKNADDAEAIDLNSAIVIEGMSGYKASSEYATFDTYVSEGATIKISYDAEAKAGTITLTTAKGYTVEITKDGVGDVTKAN